jgi:hypothetical protein
MSYWLVDESATQPIATLAVILSLGIVVFGTVGIAAVVIRRRK